jgi:hypothetical protein
LTLGTGAAIFAVVDAVVLTPPAITSTAAATPTLAPAPSCLRRYAPRARIL